MFQLTTSNNKNQLLEPIASSCRLILLKYKPINTKIAVYNHRIIIQEPSYDQCLKRTLYGDKRDNIYVLFMVIYRIIKWYIEPLRETEQSEYLECITELMNYLIDGLKIIQQTYKYGNSVMTLQYFINILKSSLNNELTDEELPSCIIESFNDQINNNLLDYDKIKSIWSYEEIKNIKNYFDECKKIKDNDELATRLTHIEYIITKKENEFIELTDLNDFIS